jgi:molybdopterin-guanine dinucleotide biosynthesis protein A
MHGFVLAGGRSSRMGRDKAFLRLAGKPLIEHAVTKLRRACDEVSILGNDPGLEDYAPIVPDIHPGCGPMGGMEAALLHPHSWHEWNLFLPVDVPFLPTAYLLAWAQHGLRSAEKKGAIVWIFTVDGVPQPTVALIHRAVGPFLTESLERREYKLLPALERAAGELAERNGFQRGEGLWKIPYWSGLRSRPGPKPKESWRYTTAAQERESARWFANLNAPEEFAEAERHTDALDT